MVAVGDKLPGDIVLKTFVDGEVKEITVEELTKGKRVVLVAVPGAFTPTCSKSHLPGFIEKADEIKAKGVDTIACVSVNDVFVMDAWGQASGTGDKVLMLADGSAVFAKALGVEIDLTAAGLGIRSKRYAAIIDDGVVTVLNIEAATGLSCSRADVVLDTLAKL